MIYRETKEYIFNFDSEEDTKCYYDTVTKLNNAGADFRTLSFGGYAFIISEHSRIMKNMEEKENK